ncbi:hypothetical protein ACN9MB_13285 [Dyella kyungheensis]|uniref:hypothetical protein n=1 Tax=Dyella kyungheensis TaxID=1242174 RepID=UPI003CECBC68
MSKPGNGHVRVISIMKSAAGFYRASHMPTSAREMDTAVDALQNLRASLLVLCAHNDLKATPEGAAVCADAEHCGLL